MKIGDQVEVHTSFDDTWAPGFEVVEIVPEGYQVRRTSDGALLPSYTSAEDLRPRR